MGYKICRRWLKLSRKLVETFNWQMTNSSTRWFCVTSNVWLPLLVMFSTTLSSGTHFEISPANFAFIVRSYFPSLVHLMDEFCRTQWGRAKCSRSIKWNPAHFYCLQLGPALDCRDLSFSFLIVGYLYMCDYYFAFFLCTCVQPFKRFLIPQANMDFQLSLGQGVFCFSVSLTDTTQI